MSTHLSTCNLARLAGVEYWKISRIFEDGDVPEPATKIGRSRAISRNELPAIIRALAPTRMASRTN